MIGGSKEEAKVTMRKASMQETVELWTRMIMQIKADGSKREEMSVKSGGRQPVVMMMWSNVHEVKGHSQYL